LKKGVGVSGSFFALEPVISLLELGVAKSMGLGEFKLVGTLEETIVCGFKGFGAAFLAPEPTFSFLTTCFSNLSPNCIV